jgi:predicted nucleic acid-binding protein
VLSKRATLRARALVLDANILIRAVLGRRVLTLLETYVNRVHFLAPETAFAEIHIHLPGILVKRGLHPDVVTRLIEDEVLGRLPTLVTPVPYAVYADMEKDARQRLAGRDETDWPFVALALTLDCPIWTEDCRRTKDQQTSFSSSHQMRLRLWRARWRPILPAQFRLLPNKAAINFERQEWRLALKEPLRRGKKSGRRKAERLGCCPGCPREATRT